MPVEEPAILGAETNVFALTVFYMEYWSDGALEYWKKSHSELFS
jgi:hypothetical protein